MVGATRTGETNGLKGGAMSEVAQTIYLGIAVGAFMGLCVGFYAGCFFQIYLVRRAKFAKMQREFERSWARIRERLEAENKRWNHDKS